MKFHTLTDFSKYVLLLHDCNVLTIGNHYENSPDILVYRYVCKNCSFEYIQYLTYVKIISPKSLYRYSTYSCTEYNDFIFDVLSCNEMIIKNIIE